MDLSFQVHYFSVSIIPHHQPGWNTNGNKTSKDVVARWSVNLGIVPMICGRWFVQSSNLRFSGLLREVARICRGCRNVQAQYTPCHCRYNLPIYLGDSFPSEAPPTNILNIPWINPTQQQSPAGKFMYFLGSTNIAGLENGPGLIESMYFIYRN